MQVCFLYLETISANLDKVEPASLAREEAIIQNLISLSLTLGLYS